MALFSFALDSFSRLTVLTLLLGVLTLIAFCVHRLYFHPLAKYPGPLLARLTNLYSAYHAWKGDLHVDMWRQHEIYGPFVRYAPNKLTVNTAQGLHDIYAGSKNFNKSPDYRLLRHGAANALTMLNKKEHARRRRIISQGVSDVAMRAQETTILSHIKSCFDKVSSTDEGLLGLKQPNAQSPTIASVKEQWTEPRDMADWLNWLTFDVMGDVIFGVRYNLLGSTASRHVPEAIEASNIRMSVLIQAPIIRQLGRIDRWLFPAAIIARAHFLSFVHGLVDRVMKPETASESQRTVASILKSTQDPITGDKLTAREILAESTTLCVAGADTSSTALAATLHYLASSPRAYQRLAHEVRAAFPCKEDVRSGPALAKLTYLRPCIEEALRLSPPAGGAPWREAQAGGATVDGETLPEGVQIGVPIYGIHHNARYFSDPFQYRPERWIAGEAGVTKEDVDTARAAFCPFSIGTRGCVGKGMAMLELQLAVAYAIYSLDFMLAEPKDYDTTSQISWGAVGEYATADHITGSKRGPFLRFRPREVQDWFLAANKRVITPALPKLVTELRPSGGLRRSASSPSLDFQFAMLK